MKRRLIVLLVLPVLLGGVFLFFSFKTLVEAQIKAQMASLGIAGAQFRLDSLSLSQMVLADVQLASGLKMRFLTLAYSPFEAWRGRLETLEITDFAIGLTQEGAVWAIDGIEAGGDAMVMHAPETDEEIAAIRLAALSVLNSNLKVTAPLWQGNFPFDLHWSRAEKKLSLESSGASITAQGLRFDGGKAATQIGFAEGKWQGDWRVQDVVSQGWPTLNAAGKITLEKQVLRVSGKVRAQDNALSFSFDFTMPLDNPARATFAVRDGVMTWADGALRLDRAAIPLDGKGVISTNITAEKIGLQPLLRLMTGQEITASGTISGALPITIASDGTFGVKTSHLAANSAGVITVPSALIPGEGMQIDLTRQVLDGFSYETLTIDAAQGKDGRPEFTLSVAGNNPKVYDGRAVKLNVRLSGDVLELLQSNIRMWMQPESILRQEKK